MGLLKLCTVWSSLLQQLSGAWLWTPASAVPQPHLALPCLWRGAGSPLTPAAFTVRPWAGCSGSEFLKSLSPLRVLFPFSVFLLFPSLPLPYRCFTVNFKIHFKSSLCKDRHEAKGGVYINFISPFSTVNCLHVLQCSLLPNPNQNIAQTKANRTNAL